jgi:hypothetical protein
MFQVFWTQYPRKVAKRAAQASWNRLNELDQKEALDALVNHLKYWKLKETSKEFIPHPATWLNQGRWEDEIDLTESVIKKPQMPWYSSEELTLAKCRELSITPYAGESFAQLRSRIQASMQRSSTV